MTDNRKYEAQKREYEDPHEDVAPVPWILLLIIAGLFSWGAFYIFNTHFRYAATVGDHRVPADFAVPETEGGDIDGHQLYVAQCVACHQATGAGIPGVFPPLVGSEWVLRKPEVLVQILLHGISGEITVKGNKYNGVMPEFRDKFNDAELAAVATYLRTELGDNSVDPVSVDLVKAEREKTADKTDHWNGDADLAPMEE
ncbi:c-type cytochrome [Alcaligenes endophyticus]|uniref:Cytochrome c n=1 Tax=Alcaligenes endophyticus TaxID=1929088 RepID=A0ABT8EGR4_9BURK|nr:cytochrome c [Alcaligenes endophyticus]MCX5589892.1 cytochrome c [Alcaligenes endophyticus]MDN4120445.1 cytochrome c [Alcaligenes endophyticus]